MQLFESAKIVALCVVAAIVYGVLHDLVTAHVAVQYFTVYHPHVVDSESPIVMALVWGVIATWHVGLAIGVMLALAARAGSPPWLGWRDLVKPVAILLCAMAACAALAGCVAAFGLWGPGAFEDADHPQRTYAVWIAHNTSYLAGAAGGVALVCWTLAVRVRSILAIK